MIAYQEIQDTLQRMEGHLNEPLDIQALAAQAHLSPYYFQRLFTRLVGRPVAEYQKQRRLARSLDELLQGDARIVDIALQLGFQNHETFSRAFREAFGVTPAEFRRSGRKSSGVTPVLMPDVTMSYQLVDEDVPLVADGVVLEITRRHYSNDRLYAGFRVDCPGGVPNGLNPGVAWNYLDDKPMRTVPHLHPQGDHAGIAQGLDSGFRYLAGCQVTHREDAFIQNRDWPGFGGLPAYLAPDYATIPPGDYLVCTFTAEDFSKLVVEAMDKVVGYFFRTFVAKHALRVEGPMIEVYDERSLRWHPSYRMENDAPHLAQREPRLSQWEGPEMEIQIKLQADCESSAQISLDTHAM